MAAFESATGISLLAGADFVEADFGKCLEVGSDGRVTIANAVTDTIVGILGYAPATTGASVNVILLHGRIKFRAGGTITAGQILVPAADGEVTGVANIDALGANVMGVGIALEGGAAGEIIEGVGYPLTSAVGV